MEIMMSSPIFDVVDAKLLVDVVSSDKIGRVPEKV
jgi:hypothetical protein